MSVPSEAVAVLQNFLDASQRGDEPGMRACLSRKTLESGQFNGSGPQGLRFVLGDPASEGEAVVIPVKGFPADSPPDQDASAQPAMQLQAIIVQEDDAWKFDLNATMERMFGGVEGALQQAVEQMGTAMQQVTEKLGEAMQEAFGSSDESPINYLEASTEYAAEELMPRLDMINLPKQTAALSAICREPVPVSAAIEDLLKQVGSNDRNTLYDWLDNVLFEGWGTMFALVNAATPFYGRLKGVRIEPAKDCENRILILDGSELVYRMHLNSTEGYYNTEWMQWLLPGLLAGLPATPDEAAEIRLVHLDNEEPPLELFKEKYVPRMMRRICELLGKNLTLEASFDEIFNPHDDVRQLYRWTLNRILGALALACRDPQRKKALTEEMTGIRILLSMLPDARHAKYEDGILEVSLQYFKGEVGAFYEAQLDRVLAGEAVIPPESSDAELNSAPANESADEQQDQDDDDQEGKDGDADGNTEEDDETIERDAIARAQKLNDENFRMAAQSLKENEPTWAMQIQMAVEHPVTLELNFDSLNGDYGLVQPFIHQGMSAVVEAFPKMMVEKQKWQDFFRKIAHVVISGSDAIVAVIATLEGGTLAVTLPLQKADVPPPTTLVYEAFQYLSGQRVTPNFKKAVVDFGGGDIYSAAAKFIRDLEAALRECDLWPGKKPPGDLEVRGAFGSENMALNQWLAWIMIPRVKDIVETRGTFPSGSNVAAYAVREWDGADSGRVIEVLRNFDDAINAQ